MSSNYQPNKINEMSNKINKTITRTTHIVKSPACMLTESSVHAHRV